MRFRRFVIAVGLLAGALAAAPPASATTYQGINFPQGASSFADSVVSFSPGAGAVSPWINPSASLGAPSCPSITNNVAGCSTSLGRSGSLVVRFDDNRLTGSGVGVADGIDDLFVFEVGQAVEGMFVSVSADGTVWRSLGAIGGATRGIDLDAFGFGAADEFRFVRLIDNGTNAYPTGNAGADVDAVGAITSVPPKAPTSTSLVSSQNPSMVHNAVTFTATVTATSGAPTGAVTFTSDGVTIPGCLTVALSAGAASCATSTLSVGDHIIGAAYAGTSAFEPSAASITQTVIRIATRLDARPLLLEAVPGVQPYLAASAALSESASGAPVAGRTVTFAAGSARCTAATGANGVATCTDPLFLLAAAPAGGFGATFAGDADYSASDDLAPLARVADVTL